MTLTTFLATRSHLKTIKRAWNFASESRGVKTNWFDCARNKIHVIEAVYWIINLSTQDTLGSEVNSHL